MRHARTVRTWLVSVAVVLTASVSLTAVPQLLNPNCSLLTPYPADALGRQTAVVRADALNGQGQPEGPAEITGYDAAGRVTATSDGLGNVTRQEYDPACGSVNQP